MAKTTRGSIIQRAPLSRTVIVSWRDQTGKRKQTWETVRGGTEREAKQLADAKLTELLSKLDIGEPVVHGKETIAEWMKVWLRDIVRVRNAPLTHQSYSDLTRNHIVPAIGTKPLAKLQAGDIDRMLANIIAPVEEGGKGRSANTAKHVYTTLHKALADAKRKKKVPRNIADDADCPNPGKYKPAIPEIDGIAHALAIAWENEPLVAPLFQLCAYTGMRRGEAIGLKWSAVDLDRGIITVRETVQRLRGQGKVVLPPKDERTRDIALDSDTVEMLRQHQGKQLLEKLDLDGIYEDKGIVFPDKTGNYLDPNRVSNTWQRIRDDAGYPGLKLHGLRHAHVHALIRAKVHPKVIQERLGHYSAAFTLDVYGDAAGLQAPAAEAYANLMKKAKEKAAETAG